MFGQISEREKVSICQKISTSDKKGLGIWDILQLQSNTSLSDLRQPKWQDLQTVKGKCVTKWTAQVQSVCHDIGTELNLFTWLLNFPWLVVDPVILAVEGLKKMDRVVIGEYPIVLVLFCPMLISFGKWKPFLFLIWKPWLFCPL